MTLEDRWTIDQAATVLAALRPRGHQQAKTVDIDSVAWWSEELALAELGAQLWRDVALPDDDRHGSALVEVCIGAYVGAHAAARARMAEAREELRRVAREVLQIVT